MNYFVNHTRPPAACRLPAAACRLLPATDRTQFRLSDDNTQCFKALLNPPDSFSFPDNLKKSLNYLVLRMCYNIFMASFQC